MREVVFALSSVVLVSGCSSCKSEKPYVPYVVEDRPPAPPQPVRPTPPVDDAGAAPSVERARVAPPNATRWNVEGLEIVAPEGQQILLALPFDVATPKRRDVLVVVRALSPKDKPSEIGIASILHYTAGAPPATVVTGKAPPSDVGCGPLARLERVGAHSALAVLGSTCVRGGGARLLRVVRLSAAPRVAFAASINDPPNAPKLDIDVDGADRDHDGTDDVALRFTIDGAGPPFESGPRLSAKLAFFDHPAGPSRDSEEPEASLRAIAAIATARATKAKEAATVATTVHQMRALHRAICDEGGAPRISKAEGSHGFSCGPSKALEDAGTAEVHALALQGDSVRAAAAADLAQAAPATKTSGRTAEIAKALADVAPLVQAKSARVFAMSVASAKAAHPEWGPLSFEGSGKLLVRTATKVVRLDPESGESSEADAPSWGTSVLSPEGKSRWLEVYHACEGFSLRATFAPTGESGDVRDVLLPVSPTLGSRCTGGRGQAVAATPIAWSKRGLEAVVAGYPVLIQPDGGTASPLVAFLDEAPPLGSPRSPNGKSIALRTSSGVLVRASRAVRYRAPELEPYNELSSCTVADDMTRLACVKRGRVVVATVEAP